MESRSSYSRRERPEDSDSVEVCVRIRPLSGKEKQEQTKSCIRIPTSFDGLSASAEEAPKQLVVGKDRAFTFDAVLGATSTQEVRVCVPQYEGMQGTHSIVPIRKRIGSASLRSCSALLKDTMPRYWRTAKRVRARPTRCRALASTRVVRSTKSCRASSLVYDPESPPAWSVSTLA